MANDITVTSGSGTLIATDETGGHHYQLAKLVDGTENSEARIPGDATYGLDVDVTRLPTISETPVTAAAGDVHAPAANTAAVVTYAATPGVKHCLMGIIWSYNGTPTNGNIKIEDGAGNVVLSADIVAAGPGILVFPRPKKAAAANVAMIITLAAGGGGVTGKVSCINHWTEA